MLHKDYKRFKDVMHIISKSKPFAMEQEETKSIWGIVYEKLNLVKIDMLKSVLASEYVDAQCLFELKVKNQLAKMCNFCVS